MSKAQYTLNRTNTDELADIIAGKIQAKFRVIVSRRVIKFIVRQVFNTVVEQVAAGKKVTILKFGTFFARERDEREGICVLPVYTRNSANTKPVHYYSPAHKVPAFKPGTSFKYYTKNPAEITEELVLAEVEGTSA